jgi:lipopolysaccharide/colanic/teichoic acid biosynthesis glycosyltransferase
MPSSSTRLPAVRKQAQAAPRPEWDWAQLNHSPGRGPGEPIRPYNLVKSLADRLLGVFIFVGCLPLMIGAAVIVKLTSRGPVIYSQIRLGRGGRPYWIYKIRTMVHDCEALTGARWATKGDSRITPIGRILRKTHIDELPQLWNVIRGDMSLVGPRPERPEIVTSLERALPGYGGRLAVKPGLTGLAQIQLPPDVDLNSVREKLALDLCYVSRYGASLDARIMVGTVLYLLGFSYAGVRHAMLLPGGPQKEARAEAVAGMS